MLVTSLLGIISPSVEYAFLERIKLSRELLNPKRTSFFKSVKYSFISICDMNLTTVFLFNSFISIYMDEVIVIILQLLILSCSSLNRISCLIIFSKVLLDSSTWTHNNFFSNRTVISKERPLFKASLLEEKSKVNH